MNENTLYDLLNEKLPFNKKQTPSGWVKFNGQCCPHNGETQDTKQRAGIIITPDGTFNYNCFNCGFKASWSKWHSLSSNMKKLLEWYGSSSEEIKKVQFYIYQMKLKNDYTNNETKVVENHLNFTNRTLPSGSKSFTEWSNIENPSKSFLNVVEYVFGRGEDIFNSFEYYWSSSSDNNMYNRVIIPFTYQGRIVGWTARSIKNDKLRYYTDVQPNYIFNNEVLYKHKRKYVILVEGPFDAIAIDGVSTLGAKISKQQIEWLNRSGKNIILLPDRDLKKDSLIDTAIENNWSVSFPWQDIGNNGWWDIDIKDAADAVKKYGRLYSLRSIIESRVTATDIITSYNFLKNKNK